MTLPMSSGNPTRPNAAGVFVQEAAVRDFADGDGSARRCSETMSGHKQQTQ